MRMHSAISSPSLASTRSLSSYERLRAAHLRPTATRANILQTIEVTPDPVTAERVFRNLLMRGTDISIGTVYRVLSDFTSAGLLAREWVSGNAGPKAAYLLLDSLAEQGHVPTHRFVCQRCGHSTAFRDVALLKELRRCVGQQLQEDWQCLTIEISDCASCRGRGLQRFDNTAQPPKNSATARQDVRPHEPL